MLRSLFSIIAAVILGLTVAKFVEGGGAAIWSEGEDPLAGDQPVSASYNLFLVLGWMAGAFAAATIALLLDRRWAPLGWLAGACIFFSACIAMMTFSLSWVLWPVAALATAAGAFAAIKLLKATTAHPAAMAEKEIFGD